jgi:dimethylhistidine N-methyltransferase
MGAAERVSQPAQTFAAAVVAGLTASPKQLEPRWLYDELGSALFEAICALPWYRVSRAERALLEREREGLGEACRGVTVVVELGPGSGEKLALLVEAVAERREAPAVHLIDISRAALSLPTRTLARAGVRQITMAEADYRDGIEGLNEVRRAGSALVAFLGSNIGNFHWLEAVGFLRQLRRHLRPDDLVLIGTDLTKPEAALKLAYDDPLGVTAAFNKNLLVRMNRELDAQFDLDAFAHRVAWNASLRRVEMHLASERAQDVAVPGAGLVAHFDAGESIWTESSYKFERHQLAMLGAATGLELARMWVDEDALFALTLFSVA